MASVLITGCSSGFGKLAALAFAREGHDVHTTVRNLGRADALRSAAADEGLKLNVVELDVTDTSSVTRAVEAVLAVSGPIDIAVNNAGIFLTSPLEATGKPCRR